MKSNLTRQFCEAISRRMDEVGMQRATLAKKLGTSPAYVSMVLNGNQNMTIRTLERIATALDFNVAIVLAPKPPRKRS